MTPKKTHENHDFCNFLFVRQSQTVWTSDSVKSTRLPTNFRRRTGRCWRCSSSTWWGKRGSKQLSSHVTACFQLLLYSAQPAICRQRVQPQQRKPDDPLKHGGHLWTHAHESEGGNGGGHAGYQVPKHCGGDPDRAQQKGTAAQMENYENVSATCVEKEGKQKAWLCPRVIKSTYRHLFKAD